MGRNSICLLDCTLRDGGYINDWEFDEENASLVVQALAQSGIEAIECGYLTTKGRPGSTLFPGLDRFNAITSILDGCASKPQLYLMVNHGEFDLASLPMRDRGGNRLDGIRLAFHRGDWVAATKEAEIVLAKGYSLCVQPMATGSYKDKEMLEMLEAVGVLMPSAFYIVDSFGSLGADEIGRLFYLAHHNLPAEIPIGLHCHNNMQLAYSNAIRFLELNKFRGSLIDSTISGIGRGAGNLNTEIIQEHLVAAHGKGYDVSPVLQVMDNYIEGLFKTKRWGYSVSNFLGGARKCHPNYASYLVEKRSLSISTVKSLLDAIPEDKLDVFDEVLAAELYNAYNEKRFSGNPGIPPSVFKGREILLVAPGGSVAREGDVIAKVIQERHPFVIALNHVPTKLVADMLFFTNQKRFGEFSQSIPKNVLLAVTSNVDAVGRFKDAYVEDYRRLLEHDGINCPNVAILLLNLLDMQGVTEVMVAGLDGYDPTTNAPQYSYSLFESLPATDALVAENHRIEEALKRIAAKIKLRLITKSLFKKSLPLNILGIIPARYSSSRFPGKPLAEILGVPMLERTYKQALMAKGMNKVIIATDDEKIYKFCQERGIEVAMTSDKCLTGTDRVAEIASRFDADLYVNIQGDEPVISPECIEIVVNAFRLHGYKYAAYNLYKEISDEAELNSNTIIKVIVNESGELVYMSRQPIPYSKSKLKPRCFKQVCVYGFTKGALELFSSRLKGCNEKFEDIEILRFIDAGLKVMMLETDYDSISVDVPEDIGKVESFLASKQLS